LTRIESRVVCESGSPSSRNRIRHPPMPGQCMYIDGCHVIASRRNCWFIIYYDITIYTILYPVVTGPLSNGHQTVTAVWYVCLLLCCRIKSELAKRDCFICRRIVCSANYHPISISFRLITAAVETRFHRRFLVFPLSCWRIFR